MYAAILIHSISSIYSKKIAFIIPEIVYVKPIFELHTNSGSIYKIETTMLFQDMLSQLLFHFY